MLQAQELKKRYGTLEVLKGVSLQIAPSEVVSVVGASGAGKSTLLQILGTLDLPDAGGLTIDGVDVLKLNKAGLAAFRNRRMGFVFQFHNLLPEFTALENVCIPAYIGGASKADAEKRGLELLERLGLADRAKHKPKELSGGEQQRVAVARALVNKPAIVFADEPSGNLDSTNAKALHKLFFDLRTDLGQTFVLVTHNAELAQMADRCLEIKDGIIVGQ